jgi:hypothetical protein
MRRKLVMFIGAGIVLLTAAALVVVFVLLRSGAPSAEQAMLQRVRGSADPGSAKILVNRAWGDGRLVLTRYDQGTQHRLALGFTIERSRGWRLAAYTEETVEPTDVVVGSLLVASSEGGEGQPPWSAAAGQIKDNRIVRVEIRWASGDVTSAQRRNGAYLVLLEGTTTPLEARYLAKDGTEVAKVPIEGAR